MAALPDPGQEAVYADISLEWMEVMRSKAYSSGPDIAAMAWLIISSGRSAGNPPGSDRQHWLIHGTRVYSPA